MGDPFGISGVFDGFRAFRSSLFGSRDPFDDPFFSQPFEDLHGLNSLRSVAQQSNGGKGVTIEELPSDEEVDEGKDSGNEKHSVSRSEPSVEHPEDDADGAQAQQSSRGKGITIEELLSDEEVDREKDSGNKKHSFSRKQPSVEHPKDDAEAERKVRNVNQRSDFKRVEGSQSQAHTFKYQTCKVTYGGVDGAYYTSTRTRRAGGDGVVLEETKEADKTTGQATHRISRGIHDKGHSLTRKLSADGRVDAKRTLHNLNEDELGSFEEAWKGNVKGRLPGWTDELNMRETTGSNSIKPERERSWGEWLLPSLQQTRRGTNEQRAGPSTSGSGTKKVVRINIE